ncbi:MAG: hypothetical protein JWM11_3342 [Planctomycetaceae bacterium]|nr:hypothetical protein [Planctomycetaceae bacterium]
MNSVTQIEQFNSEFVEAVKALAETEATGVAQLLDAWHLRSQSASEAPFDLSPEFLLAVAISLRFKIWELNNHRWHLDAGLPSSDEILTRALQPVLREDLGTLTHHLHVTSLQIFQDHFVWYVKAQSQVNLTFDDSLDDEHLDAIADFLWNNRHALRTNGESQ